MKHLMDVTLSSRTWSISLTAVLGLLLAFGGCAGRPLKGGRAVTAPKAGGGLEQSLSQGDNPSQPSTQQQESIKVRTYTVPAGSRFESATAGDGERGASGANGKLPIANCKSVPSSSLSSPSSILYSPSSTLVLSAPMPVTEREESRAATQLGAAQKDSARELGAKLSSLRGIVWVGLGLFLFGLGTIFYAPLRALIGSLTTSLAITLGGLALMVLPTLIVGNELLLLGGVAVAVGGWFLAHRHGQLRGQVAGLADSTPETSSSSASSQRQ
jgi:hypothetical protein